jgi:gas vesicle protein
MGRFLIGLAIGLALGAVAVILAGPRSGRPQAVGELVEGAMAAARRASDLRQQEMWAGYRERLKQEKLPAPTEKRPWE